MDTKHTPGPALYWRTRYGSLCERVCGPDKSGWMTVRRLSDYAQREWNVADMTPVPDADAIAECRAALAKASA
jgi:hypothetical protein